MRGDEDVVPLEERVVDDGQRDFTVSIGEGRVRRSQGAAPDLATAADDRRGLQGTREGAVGLGCPPVGGLTGNRVVDALGDEGTLDRITRVGVLDPDRDLADGWQGHGDGCARRA